VHCREGSGTSEHTDEIGYALEPLTDGVHGAVALCALIVWLSHAAGLSTEQSRIE